MPETGWILRISTDLCNMNGDFSSKKQKKIIEKDLAQSLDFAIIKTSGSNTASQSSGVKTMAIEKLTKEIEELKSLLQ